MHVPDYLRAISWQAATVLFVCLGLPSQQVIPHDAFHSITNCLMIDYSNHFWTAA